MKKILPSLLSLFSAAALFAGDLSLSDKAGNPVPDGMVIHLWGDVNTSLMKFDFDARNVGTNTHVSRMKKLEIFEVPNTTNMFCWDVCYQHDSFIVSTYTVTLNPNQTWLYGATDYYPQGQLGTTIVRYTVFRTSAPYDSSYFVVQYHVTGVGMEEFASRGLQLLSAPNPSSANFTILLPGETSAEHFQVEVFSSDGKKVLLVEADKNGGAVPVTLPEKGVYFIRVYSDQQLIGVARQIILN